MVDEFLRPAKALGDLSVYNRRLDAAEKLCGINKCALSYVSWNAYAGNSENTIVSLPGAFNPYPSIDTRGKTEQDKA